MLLATPLVSDTNRPIAKRRSSQWDSFTFTEIELEQHVSIVPPHTKHPRRNSLKIKTQTESLAHSLVSSKQKFRTTLLAVSAFLDLLRKVREQQGTLQKEQEAPATEISNLAAGFSNLNAAPEKHLRFGSVQIRQYETILEVNPGSSKGPAVGIGWRYHQSDIISVDEYEDTRPPRRKIGKDYRPLTGKKRLAILKEQGYSEAELEQAIKATDEAREKRRKTIASLRKHRGEDKCEEKREMAALKLTRFAHLRRSSNEEIQQLWIDANSPGKPKRKGLIQSLSFTNRHDKK